MNFVFKPQAASRSPLPAPLSICRNQKCERAVADERPRQKSSPDGLKVLLPKTLISYAMRIF